jgi:hypothetical protein
MAISLSAEMNDFFLTVGTGFNHFLLTWRCGGSWFITRHVLFTGHSFLLAASALLVQPFQVGYSVHPLP